MGGFHATQRSDRVVSCFSVWYHYSVSVIRCCTGVFGLCLFVEVGTEVWILEWVL